MADTTNTMAETFNVNATDHVYQDSTMSYIFDRQSHNLITIKTLDVLKNEVTHEKIYYDFDHDQYVNTNRYYIEEV